MEQQKYTPLRSLSSSFFLFVHFNLTFCNSVSDLSTVHVQMMKKKSKGGIYEYNVKLMTSIMIMSYLFKVQREQVEYV